MSESIAPSLRRKSKMTKMSSQQQSQRPKGKCTDSKLISEENENMYAYDTVFKVKPLCWFINILESSSVSSSFIHR